MKRAINPILNKTSNPSSLLEVLKDMHILTDEEYEPFKELKTVYVITNDRIIKHELAREDFSKDINDDIFVKRIRENLPVKNYFLFATYDAAFVYAYENYHIRKIQKHKRELEELALLTQQYNKICEDKPHLIV